MPVVIVCLGEILWDLFPDGKQLGGAPANFAYHCKTLGLDGVESYIISSIGNDSLGQEILIKLDNNKINTKYLHLSSTHPTGISTVSVDKQGIPNYSIEQNVAWDVIPEIVYDWQQGIDIVYFGTLAQRSPISHSSINKFLPKLPDSTVKIFDINLRQSFFSLDIIESSLNHATVLKINDDELKLLAKLIKISGNEEQLLQAISQHYHIKLCILTKGSAGSILYSNNNTSYHSGCKVNCLDTVGAGDAFSAAIALGMLKGFDIDSLNNTANQVASFVCSQQGATPKLPAELVSLFNKKM